MKVDPDRRRKDLARIHIVAKALGLDDEARRDVIFSLTRQKSCADLDYTGLQLVREHLEERARSRGMKVGAAGVSSRDRMVRMIRALWLELGENGKLHDRSERALFSFTKRQTGVERPEWCSMRQKDQVIEALKAWLAR